MNIAMLTALNWLQELMTHILGVFHNGFTREEVAEPVLHMVSYYGFPAASESMRLVKQVPEALDNTS